MCSTSPARARCSPSNQRPRSKRESEEPAHGCCLLGPPAALPEQRMIDPRSPVRFVLAGRERVLTLYKSRAFKRACVLGDDVVIGPQAGCSNDSGDPLRIQLADHSTVYG